MAKLFLASVSEFGYARSMITPGFISQIDALFVKPTELTYSGR